MQSRGSRGEGRIVVNGTSATYEFFMKDHLGNTRVTFNESGGLVQTLAYYPFGMEMTTDGNADNQFRYNGKEMQEGTDWYDYGARMYDPAIARWHVIDPAADVLESSSPFVYSLNNPINFIDQDGELPIFINGRVMSADKRGDKSYWDRELLNTIKNSGIANPGEERHFVDGVRYVDYQGLYDRTGAVKEGSWTNGHSAGLRYAAGKQVAKSDFKNILSKLARDPESDKIIEKIQIDTHSRGAAFGAVYTQVLLEMISEYADQFEDPGSVVEFVLNLAPHQSNGINSPLGDSFSMHHIKDLLSGNGMNGVFAAFSSDIGDGTKEAHASSSFTKEVGSFLQSFQSGGTSQQTIDDFVKRMQNEYGITVTVNYWL